MSITVEHRSDRLLQNSVREGIPAGTEGTYIDRVTMPMHRLLLLFLEAYLIGREFSDDQELASELKKWSDFAESNGGVNELNKDWREVYIVSPEYAGGEYKDTIAAGSGPFVIGSIRRSE